MRVHCSVYLQLFIKLYNRGCGYMEIAENVMSDPLFSKLVNSVDALV